MGIFFGSQCHILQKLFQNTANTHQIYKLTFPRRLCFTREQKSQLIQNNKQVIRKSKLRSQQNIIQSLTSEYPRIHSEINMLQVGKIIYLYFAWMKRFMISCIKHNEKNIVSNSAEQGDVHQMQTAKIFEKLANQSTTKQ